MESRKEETGEQGWMGSNSRRETGGAGGARETWRSHWTGEDDKATEEPMMETGENTKRLRKLIFLSRITG